MRTITIYPTPLPNMVMPFEPKRKSHWIIKVYGRDKDGNTVEFKDEFPSYLFKNYKMYNIGKDIMLEVALLEAVHTNIHPDYFFQITEVHILYLDPVGDVVNTLKLEIKKMYFSTKGDYSSDGLLTHHLTMKVKPKLK